MSCCSLSNVATSRLRHFGSGTVKVMHVIFSLRRDRAARLTPPTPHVSVRSILHGAKALVAAKVSLVDEGPHDSQGDEQIERRSAGGRS